jgi:hypothetical protein
VSGRPEVDAWFEDLDHPQREAMLRARDVVLGADPRVTETIKWKCPTFMFEGNIVSIQPQAKQHVSLLFHQGARIPGKHPLLQGGGGTARYMRFADLDDVEAKRAELEAAIRAWCEMRSG